MREFERGLSSGSGCVVGAHSIALRTLALRARLWENQFATRDLLAGAPEDGEPAFATRILASVSWPR